MGGLAAFLMSLAVPLVSRVFLALGIGTVTYVGISAALNQALGAAKTAFGGLGAEVAALVAMAGGFEALSIIAGGMVASVGMMVLKKFALKAAG